MGLIQIICEKKQVCIIKEILQVRVLLPSLCLAIMRILVDQFDANPTWKEKLALQADAIIAFVARIPYEFPSEVNTKILELNSRIHS